MKTGAKEREAMSPRQARRPLVVDRKLAPSVSGLMPCSISASRRSFSRNRTRIRFTITCTLRS